MMDIVIFLIGWAMAMPENTGAIENDQKQQLSEESASVQSHLQIMQGVIQRMASNSTSCKAWCITIVSAILVLIADKNKPELAWLPCVSTSPQANMI